MNWVTSAQHIDAPIVILAGSDESEGLERDLRSAGYRWLRDTSDAHDALRLVQQFRPDLIILDLAGQVTGIPALIRALAVLPEYTGYLPVLVIAEDAQSKARLRALRAGAGEYLASPYGGQALDLRVHDIIEMSQLCKRLHRNRESIESELANRTREVVTQAESQGKVEESALQRLALVAGFRQQEIEPHIQRVARLVALLAYRLGLRGNEVEELQRAAALHDLGNVHVPDSVLMKPGPLTPDEFLLVKTHTTAGAALLSGQSTQMLRIAREVALFHHERWDGSGYPFGLVGEAIPLPARILAVADVYDALTSNRPYRQAWPVERATAEISRQRARQFDPQVVEALLAVRPGLVSLDVAGTGEPVSSPALAD